MSELADWQRRITRLALETIGEDGFALAGSGAIREHGVTNRPTEDVDLFTTSMDSAAFDQAVEHVTRAWTDNGLDVSLNRQAPLYAQFPWPRPTATTWTSTWAWTGEDTNPPAWK